MFPGAFAKEAAGKVTRQCFGGCVTGPSAPQFALCLLSQISTTARATPVKTVAPASMVLTPTSVSVVTAGRECTVKTVSLLLL